MSNPNLNDPQMEPLGRIQILAAMGVTALVLLLISRFWLLFESVFLLPVRFGLPSVLQGLAIGVGITLASMVTYQLWPHYRRSADLYLKLVLAPLVWTDLIWMGLLPGLSEEFLFRGVMLPAIGLNATGVIFSSLCFGILHLSGLQQWSYVVWATIIGLVLGGSALVTGNLLVPIVAHIVTNLVSSVMWKWRFRGE
ncbi:CPBP family intramembrane glutamic endopeptidase [Leptolyngbya sp. PCC 6406]|uniref:CPBP family intramembrane glutamic endopeptidase n=1 Tax=Leptolyngbya sp. PCC 6406 TaxID=1173264 RepID=UPI0002ACFAF1|nr:CPBP family intramembrane glutamic endopeptidase [Leptolyngbya sp. PCC 6406]